MNTVDLGERARRVKLAAFHTVYGNREYMPDRRRALLLIYCCRGSAVVTVEDKEYSLTPGWLILSRVYAKHIVSSDDARAQCYLMEAVFDPAGVDLVGILEAASYTPFALVFQSSDLYVRFDTEENRILLTLGELSNELQSRETANRRIVSLLFETLLIKLERAVQAHGRATGPSYVSAAKQYIRENLSADITVQSVANHIGIHRSYLMRIFRQQTRMSVNQYINRMRVTQATVLLSGSDLSITEIAFHVGFNSRQNFYVVFEKLIGCSPSKYRVSHSGKKPDGAPMSY